MTEEIWKPVVGFEGLYEVSSLGRLKSLYRRTEVKPKHKANYIREWQEHIMSPTIFNGGYVVATLKKDGIKVKKQVHKMVAEAHIPNPRGLNEIDHINTCRSDNRVENLRWVTRSENHLNPLTRINHSIASKALAIKRFGGKCLDVKPVKKPRIRKGRIKKEKVFKTVVQLSLSYELVAIYASCREASEKTGILERSIRKGCAKELKSSKGYIWLYEADYITGNYKVYDWINDAAERTYARKVIQCSIDGTAIRLWNSISDASKGTSTNASHISQCCLGRERQAGGYLWRYAKK